MPNQCSLQGTRRWHPNHCFEETRKDFEDTLLSISVPPDVSIDSFPLAPHCHIQFQNEVCLLLLPESALEAFF